MQQVASIYKQHLSKDGDIVLQYVPHSTGMFTINVYFEVEHNAKINLELNYTDSTKKQTLHLINTKQAAGSYSITPTFITSIAEPIRIVGDADSEGVYVTVSIVKH
jgi:hypothetical protein